MNLKKQLACIYTNNFFSGLRITDAVWVALLAARGFSLWEIGVAACSTWSASPSRCRPARRRFIKHDNTHESPFHPEGAFLFNGSTFCRP